jgi:hypothetical protein
MAARGCHRNRHVEVLSRCLTHWMCARACCRDRSHREWGPPRPDVLLMQSPPVGAGAMRLPPSTESAGTLGPLHWERRVHGFQPLPAACGCERPKRPRPRRRQRGRWHMPAALLLQQGAVACPHPHCRATECSPHGPVRGACPRRRTTTPDEQACHHTRRQPPTTRRAAATGACRPIPRRYAAVCPALCSAAARPLQHPESAPDSLSSGPGARRHYRDGSLPHSRSRRPQLAPGAPRTPNCPTRRRGAAASILPMRDDSHLLPQQCCSPALLHRPPRPPPTVPWWPPPRRQAPCLHPGRGLASVEFAAHQRTAPQSRSTERENNVHGQRPRALCVERTTWHIVSILKRAQLAYLGDNTQTRSPCSQTTSTAHKRHLARFFSATHSTDAR